MLWVNYNNFGITNDAIILITDYELTFFRFQKATFQILLIDTLLNCKIDV